MISPELLDIKDKNKIIKLFEQVNINITANIINRLSNTKIIDSYTLSQLNYILQNNGDEIFLDALEQTTSINLQLKNELKALFNEMIKDDMSSYLPLYKFRGLDFKLTPLQLSLLNAGLKTTSGLLENLTHTVAFAAQQIYVEAVDKTFMQVATGSTDYETAIRKTVLELAKKGITLKDSIGREIQLKTAVKRNLLMGLQQTANQINEDVGQELGCNGYETTAHTGARPSHQVWQGKQFAKTKEDAEKYGVGLWDDVKDELNDYNCRHHYSGIILGVSSPAYTKKELKEMQDPDLNQRLNKIKSKQSKKSNLQRTKKILEKSNINANKEVKSINEKINKINKDINEINKNKTSKYTKDEKGAFNYYISPSSITLNEKLRNNLKLDDYEDKIVKNLDKALEKTNNYSGDIVRVLEMDDPQAFANQLKNDKKYSTNQYLSFSNKEHYNDNANVKIYISNSKGGKDLTKINQIGEGEILYQRNKEFIPLHIEEKDGIIYMLWEEL